MTDSIINNDKPDIEDKLDENNMLVKDTPKEVDILEKQAEDKANELNELKQAYEKLCEDRVNATDTDEKKKITQKKSLITKKAKKKEKELEEVVKEIEKKSPPTITIDKETKIKEIIEMCTIMGLKVPQDIVEKSDEIIMNTHMDLTKKCLEYLNTPSDGLTGVMISVGGLAQAFNPTLERRFGVSLDGYTEKLIQKRENIKRIMAAIVKDNPKIMEHLTPVNQLIMLMATTATETIIENRLKKKH